MALNVNKTTGKNSVYNFDKGNMPAEFGPYIGEVVNNVDPTRSGRLQVYITQFSGGDKTNKSLWRTVSPIQQQGGATPKTSTSTGVGTYGSTNNQQSYGSAAPGPDIGTQVLCIFVAGQGLEGYYIGIIPTQGVNHMTPAIGATSAAEPQNKNQSTYFAKAPQLPVSEINNAEENTAITENPKFYDQKKPVHSYAAQGLFQQGVVNDPIRGPITSSSQRESPSTVSGMSTPGRPVYKGGYDDATVVQKVSSGSVAADSVDVVGRKGGHSVVLDDGDASGKNSMVRFRTAKGHQVTLSDDGNNLYIAHANGQVWLEFGQEGTLDVYTTNSINLRTEGTINLHADKDINMYAGGNLNLKGIGSTAIQSDGDLNIANKGKMTLFSQGSIGIKSTGSLALDSQLGSWSAKAALSLKGTVLLLNSGPGLPVQAPKGLTKYLQPNSEYNATTGWKVSPTGTESICTRAPTHEPYPYHNQGVAESTNLSDGTTSSPPDAPSVPDGVTITADN